MSDQIVISLSLSLSKHVLAAMQAYAMTETVTRMTKSERKDIDRFNTYLEQRIGSVSVEPVEVEKLL